MLREPLPVTGSWEGREQWKSLTAHKMPLPDLLRIGDEDKTKELPIWNRAVVPAFKHLVSSRVQIWLL